MTAPTQTPDQEVQLDGNYYRVAGTGASGTPFTNYGISTGQKNGTSTQFDPMLLDATTQRLMADVIGYAEYSGLVTGTNTTKYFQEIADAHSSAAEVTTDFPNPGLTWRIRRLDIAIKDTAEDVTVYFYDSVTGDIDAGRIAAFTIDSAAMSGIYPVVPDGGFRELTASDSKLMVKVVGSAARDFWVNCEVDEV